MCENTAPRNSINSLQFPPLNLLRNCNRLAVSDRYFLDTEAPIKTQKHNSSNMYENSNLLASNPKNISPATPTLFSPTFPFDYQQPTDYQLPSINRFGAYSVFFSRRQRGEKRPIPDEQKDDKYYERRKRNNEAAKKSRDARKIREDRIAFRAALLEQENAILRAQLIALREEIATMRQLLSSRPAQISVNI